jgi:hypothetical protein
MKKILLGFVSTLFIAFTLYLFLSGNMLLGFIVLVATLVFLPLVVKASKGQLHIGAAPDPKSYGSSDIGGPGM